MYRSVFVKLVLVMLVMASCLIVLVAGFFWLIVSPTVGASVDRMLDDYARRFAQESPGEEEARRLAARLELQVRYEGPDGSWTTDERLPTIAEAQQAAHGREVIGASGHSRHLVRAPNGGHYLLDWEFGRRNAAAHDKLLLLLLAMMLAVLVVAHAVLRRGLRPLRALQDGVARIERGDLDVALPVRARDEFGALTAAFNPMAAGVREMVRARDQLLLDVSHELRSPLTRLKVALALLPDSAKKTQAEADVAEMEALVAELLEFERLRDGRALRIERLDLVPLLREAARPYHDALARRRASVCAPGAPARCETPTALRQRAPQPARERRQVLAAGQPPGRGHGHDRERPRGRPRRRRRPRHPRGRPRQALRAVLPRRPLALAEDRRLRPRARASADASQPPTPARSAS